jgi:REP element-mobilizing transposase RayT
MSILFNNKYRIPSARLQNWNYANEAMYFVTICTKNRQNYFGEIITNVETPYMASLQTDTPKIQLTEIGKIAHSEWYKSIEMRPDMNLALGEFVVMPNHIHGIIMIGTNKYNTTLDSQRDSQRCRDAMHCVSTNANANEYKNQFAPQSKNLSSIIRGYKSAVTAYAKKNGIDFGWQSRFHDHIIRSSDEYHKISNYIINNPAKWQEDKFYQI